MWIEICITSESSVWLGLLNLFTKIDATFQLCVIGTMAVRLIICMPEVPV